MTRISRGTDTGRLAKWWPDRAYGFVVVDNGGEVFIHKEAFIDIGTVGLPVVGQLLRFDLSQDRRGLRAVRAVRAMHR